MTQFACPKCRRAIAPHDLNPATNLALCGYCERGFAFSDLVSVAVPPSDVQHPPAGAWYRRGPGSVEIGATTRSAVALLLLPVLVIFCFGSAASAIHYGVQIEIEALDRMASLVGLMGSLVRISAMGGLSLLFVALGAMACAGEVKVAIGPDRLRVFAGAYGLGRSKEIFLRDIIGVSANADTIGVAMMVERGAVHYCFGSLLEQGRRDFILRALRQALSEADNWSPPPTSASASPADEAS